MGHLWRQRKRRIVGLCHFRRGDSRHFTLFFAASLLTLAGWKNGISDFQHTDTQGGDIRSRQ